MKTMQQIADDFIKYLNGVNKDFAELMSMKEDNERADSADSFVREVEHSVDSMMRNYGFYAHYLDTNPKQAEESLHMLWFELQMLKKTCEKYWRVEDEDNK